MKNNIQPIYGRYNYPTIIMLRTTKIPGALIENTSSFVSIVRRFYSPRAYISKVLYSEGSIVR